MLKNHVRSLAYSEIDVRLRNTPQPTTSLIFPPQKSTTENSKATQYFLLKRAAASSWRVTSPIIIYAIRPHKIKSIYVNKCVPVQWKWKDWWFARHTMKNWVLIVLKYLYDLNPQKHFSFLPFLVPRVLLLGIRPRFRSWSSYTFMHLRESFIFIFFQFLSNTLHLKILLCINCRQCLLLK